MSSGTETNTNIGVQVSKNGSGKHGKYLYLVSRTDDGGGWDTYSDFVCCADSEDQARNIHPDGCLDENDVGFNWNHEDGGHGTWIPRKDVHTLDVICIGIAQNQVIGVILSDFHAG